MPCRRSNKRRGRFSESAPRIQRVGRLGTQLWRFAWALFPVAAFGENPAEVFELPSVTVIGTTPLPGLGTAARDVPANVQLFGSRDIGRQRPLDLTEFLDRNANDNPDAP